MDIWSKSTVEVVVVVVTSQMVRNKMVGAGSCLNIAESIPSGFLGKYSTSKTMIYFTPFFYYSSAKLMDIVSSKPISWFRDFIGVGYRYHDVYMNVIPLFQDKVPAYRLWKKTIDWWPDDKIKLRFVEQHDSYWLIIYGGSIYKGDNTGFVKKVQASDNYERFKAGYENKAILRFGIYKENPKKKDDDRKYDLEILKKSKSVYDIAFLKYEELSPESIEWQCIEENK